MRKTLLFMMVFEMAMVGWCGAGEYEAGLTVGDTSLYGSLHYKSRMMDGFWKAGGSGLYADKDNIEYKWLELDFSVGNETLQPGLVFDVGFKGILGDAELNPVSGDVGALAFSGKVAYILSSDITFIPIEAYVGISYAPQILSFGDNENYLAYHVGLAFYIMDNAALVAEYDAYDVDMESGPGEWTLDDNVFRFGLKMHF